MTQTKPLILTLKLDHATFTLFNELRRAHFPSRRNNVPAHVTLFHALPGEHESTIHSDLAQASVANGMFALNFSDVQFLGRGVAITLDAPEFVTLRSQLATNWRHWLSAQDQQRYRPHITIQNKVAPEVARLLFAELDRSWKPVAGLGEGLVLWRYLDGPWEQIAEFPFAGSTRQQKSEIS